DPDMRRRGPEHRLRHRTPHDIAMANKNDGAHGRPERAEPAWAQQRLANVLERDGQTGLAHGSQPVKAAGGKDGARRRATGHQADSACGIYKLLNSRPGIGPGPDRILRLPGIVECLRGGAPSIVLFRRHGFPHAFEIAGEPAESHSRARDGWSWPLAVRNLPEIPGEIH